VGHAQAREVTACRKVHLAREASTGDVIGACCGAASLLYCDETALEDVVPALEIAAVRSATRECQMQLSLRQSVVGQSRCTLTSLRRSRRS
jgi:hypothetical protein